MDDRLLVTDYCIIGNDFIQSVVLYLVAFALTSFSLVTFTVNQLFYAWLYLCLP